MPKLTRRQCLGCLSPFYAPAHDPQANCPECRRRLALYDWIVLASIFAAGALLAAGIRYLAGAM